VAHGSGYNSQRRQEIVGIDVLQLEDRLFRGRGTGGCPGWRVVPFTAVFEDLPDHRGLVALFQDGDDFHLAAAVRAYEWVNFVYLLYTDKSTLRLGIETEAWQGITPACCVFFVLVTWPSAHRLTIFTRVFGLFGQRLFLGIFHDLSTIQKNFSFYGINSP